MGCVSGTLDNREESAPNQKLPLVLISKEMLCTIDAMKISELKKFEILSKDAMS